MTTFTASALAAISIDEFDELVGDEKDFMSSLDIEICEKLTYERAAGYIGSSYELHQLYEQLAHEQKANCAYAFFNKNGDITIKCEYWLDYWYGDEFEVVYQQTYHFNGTQWVNTADDE